MNYCMQSYISKDNTSILIVATGNINQEIKTLCKQDADIIITPHSPLQTMMATVI